MIKLMLLFAAFLCGISGRLYATVLPVYIIAGQSNAAGLGKNSELKDFDISLENPQIDSSIIARIIFDPNEVPTREYALQSVKPGLGGDLDTFGPELSLGKYLPGEKVFIKYTVGGTILADDWLSGKRFSDKFVQYVQSQLSILRANYPERSIEIRCVFWIQGEGDAQAGRQDSYLTNLLNFADSFNNSIAAGDTPWVIANVNSAQAPQLGGSSNIGGAWSTIQAAQSAAGVNRTWIKVISTEGLSLNPTDGIHYSAAGMIGLGKKLADAYLYRGRPIPRSSPLTNISLGAFCDSGSKQVTLGTSVEVDSKFPILLRAVGRTLANFGLTEALLDSPRIVGSSGIAPFVIGADNPSVVLDAISAQLWAFPIGNTDASVLANINSSGSYTFAINAATPGYGLFELYDAMPLIDKGVILNLSGKAWLSSAHPKIVLGFCIRGGSPDLLVRACGPSLGAYGVANPLLNPKLTVYNQSGNVVASNDDWDALLAPIFSQVGAYSFDLNSHDAAVKLSSLAPGSYTVQIESSIQGAEGFAMVELYLVR